MNEYLNTSVEAKRMALDIHRAVRIETGARLFILKRENHSQNFIVVTEILEGWNAKPTKYKNEREFEIATASENFHDLLMQGSYIGYGVPDTDNEIDIYQINPDERDETQNDGYQPTWKNFAVRVPNERFTIPAVEIPDLSTEFYNPVLMAEFANEYSQNWSSDESGNAVHNTNLQGLLIFAKQLEDIGDFILLPIPNQLSSAARIALFNNSQNQIFSENLNDFPLLIGRDLMVWLVDEEDGQVIYVLQMPQENIISRFVLNETNLTLPINVGLISNAIETIQKPTFN